MHVTVPPSAVRLSLQADELQVVLMCMAVSWILQHSTCRQRVRREIFKGKDVDGAHRTGSEGAAWAILSYAAVAYGLYAYDTNAVTGFLLGG